MTTRHPKYEWCEGLIIEQIVGPRLVETIRAHKPGTKKELLQLFNATNGSHATMSHLNDWLDFLKINVERQCVFTTTVVEEAPHTQSPPLNPEDDPHARTAPVLSGGLLGGPVKEGLPPRIARRNQ